MVIVATTFCLQHTHSARTNFEDDINGRHPQWKITEMEKAGNQLVGPGIASGGLSDCTIFGSLGTSISSSYSTSVVLAGDDELLLQGCGGVQPAGRGVEVA